MLRRRSLLQKSSSVDYLTFTALESGTFKFTKSINYSIDGGKTWTALASYTNSPTVESGRTIMWKASLTPEFYSGIGNFSSSGKFNVEGNPMSLLYDDDIIGRTSLEGKESAFQYLFQDCTKLKSAEYLILPATTLERYCYYAMFYGCTQLTTAPELPATTLADNCYFGMFRGCKALSTAPELPATTLASYCYSQMFYECTSIKTAPALSATTLANHCYDNMFEGCTGLKTAPELPATTLVNGCYYCMFYNCSWLTTAPALPATTLAESCYYAMFYGCGRLTTAPVLPATTLVSNCYYEMFYNCYNLNYIKAMFTTTPSDAYTKDWVYKVKSSGTFVKNWYASWDVTGTSGIPSGWTVETASE